MNRTAPILICAVIFCLPSPNTRAGQIVEVVSDLGNHKASFNLQHSDASGTALTVEFPAVKATNITLDGRAYKKLELPEGEFLTAGELAEDGRPDIPVLSTNLIIPDMAGVSLHVTYSGYDEIDNFDLAPVQPSPLESGDVTPIPFTIDNTTYTTDAFYPGTLTEASTPQIMRDIRFVQVSFYPAQYNPVTRKLRLYRDLSVSISYDGEVINPKTVHHRCLSDGFYPIYSALFSNFDQLYGTTDVKRGGYVIICRPSLADTVKAVARWKHQKGYSVRIVPTTEINSNGSPTNLQIFDYLQNAYESWEVPPEYVMILGDHNGTYAVNDYPWSGFASDHEYACVDGDDYMADIFVARMSVSTMLEARVALSKILKYEKYPWMTDPQHWIRGLSAAATYYESARLVTLWVRQTQLQHGFVLVDTAFTGSEGQLPFYFNRGLSFIQYRGAGSWDGWYDPMWFSSNLRALPNNQKLGVMASLTCGTGDFGSECFGETWIRMGLSVDSLKGGPAFYGVTDGNTHTRWNNPIMVGYYFGIFGENIYHFAAAAVRGKLQEWLTFPRYRGRGGYVDQYLHTYNMLGDPELEMRTAIPKYLLVTHPDTVAFGPNHAEITVADAAGAPITGAFVTLIKGNSDATDEFFSLGKTDQRGMVSLAFNAQTIGPMTLTVTGQNLYPYQTSIQIVDSELAVGLDSIFIDDDMLAPSYGDGDGMAAAGETLELSVWLRNYGTALPATNLTTTLETDDDWAMVFDGVREFGDLLPGQAATTEQPYVVKINPYTFDNETARLKLTVTDGANHSWYSLIELPVKAPRLVVSGAIIPEGDSILSPGETANLILAVNNIGSLDAVNVTGTITSNDDYATVINSSGDFGDIAIDSSGNNAGSPMSISCESDAFEGHTIDLILHASMETGTRADIPFTLGVGSVSRNDPVGPDGYGYFVYDTRDSLYSCMPTYQWVEISPDSANGQGERITYSSNYADDESALITLPFDMFYYGEHYGALIVSINGFVSPDTFRMDMGGHFWANFFNWPIPDPGNAAAQISPFWDDLRLSGSTHLGVYKWYDIDNHKFYIEWLKMTHANVNGIYETFQLVITDPAYHPTLTGDSEILFIYRDINNRDSGENYSSVGFESWDEHRGIELSHDNFYALGSDTLADGQIFLITTNTGRGGIKGRVELDNGGDNSGVRVSASSGQYRITPESGDFWLRETPRGIVTLRTDAAGYFPARVESLTVTPNVTIEGVDFNPIICPVPANFVASDSIGGQIELGWTAVEHPDLAGYNVFRGPYQTGDFVKLNTAPIFGNSYVDNDVQDSAYYWYYATAVFVGPDLEAESFASNKDRGTVGQVGVAGDGESIPLSFFLSQNYPNPFNPNTTISYGLPNDSDVKIEIFNLLGQRVTTLVNERQKAGFKQIVWDGRDNIGRIVSSGVYFYRIDAGNFGQSKKMLLLK